MDPYNALIYTLAYIGFFLVSFYVLGMVKLFKKSICLPKSDLSVSIVIPAYNEEGSIEKTINSALSLDYPSGMLEVIVVDDGSRDKTYSIAKSIALDLKKRGLKGHTLKLFTKKNGGKGSALNLGISKSSSQIIVTMDADTMVAPDSLKKMIGYFYSKNVMSVTPSIGIYKPESIWQRVQHIEYYMSVFLRKSFGVLNAIHITPGAFAAYRKEFFIKYGGFDENNITEDIEISLRIQSKNYIIENTPYATVYTISPKTFKQFLAQRKRWYVGYITNLWNYRSLFSSKYGPLGTIVLPAAVITLVLAVITTCYSAIKGVFEMKDDLELLSAVGYNFSNMFELNRYVFEALVFRVFSQPIWIFSFIFIAFLSIYLIFSRRTMQYKENIFLNFIAFIFLYSLIYSLFWIISLLHLSTRRKVKWK